MAGPKRPPEFVRQSFRYELVIVQSSSEATVAPLLVWLILFLCLVISIVKYTLALILKLSVPKATVKKDYTYQPTVSVLMPCFNEGKTVYETIESISK